MAKTSAPTKSQLGELADWIAELPREFLDCREANRHTWAREIVWQTPIWYRVRKVCRSCGMEENEIRSRETGRKLASFGKETPTDYAKPDGAPAGRVSRALFADELVERSGAPLLPLADLTAAEARALERAAGKDDATGATDAAIGA